MNGTIYTEDHFISRGRAIPPFAGIEFWGRILALSVFFLFFPIRGDCSSDQTQDIVKQDAISGIKITHAVICEDVKDGLPVSEGIVFSASLNRITCFTEFDRITEKTIIYHCWYFKDNLRAKRKPLVLNPPKWSTYSQIEPRETDRGPWRVEIIDEDGNILETLRFSIID